MSASFLSVRTAQVVQQARAPAGDDRLDVFACGSSLALVVADGAGGRGNGSLAADAVARFVRAALLADEHVELAELLMRADRAVLAQANGGETTSVVIVLDAAGVGGRHSLARSSSAPMACSSTQARPASRPPWPARSWSTCPPG